MTYDEVIAQLEQSQASHTLNVDKSWTQGRTLFGGLTAGLIYQAMAMQADAISSLSAIRWS